MPRRGFRNGDVRDWPAWAGGECPCCGAFLKAAGWPSEVSVPCASCVESPPPFAARSLFVYEGNVREGIRAAKYAKGKLPADALAERLLQAIRGRWSDRFPDGFRPIVVPVPIRPWKYFRRGFNLPALVGSSLSRKTGWPFDPRVLRRSGGDLPQAGLTFAARRGNVLGAFRAAGGRACAPDALLLDDVYTSGATAREAALALKTAGAENIVVLTVARTVP